VITSENEDNSIVKKTGRSLAPSLMKFEAGCVSIVPLIMIYIIVLATAKLNFVVSVVPTKCIDKALVVHSREKGLLGGHGGSDPEFTVLILEVRVSCSVCA
jgi:hypothetical protein